MSNPCCDESNPTSLVEVCAQVDSLETNGFQSGFQKLWVPSEVCNSDRYKWSQMDPNRHLYTHCQS